MHVQISRFESLLWIGLSLCFMTACNGSGPNGSVRQSGTIYAEVVALDQPITYNRFGSFNPYGMIYALKRDVVDTEKCNAKGECRPMSDDTKPGHVRLRASKRPRPLVLRVNEGDRLVVKFYNMLMPQQPDTSSRETASRLPDTGLGLHYKGILKAEKEEPGTLPAEEGEFVAEVTGEAADPSLAGASAEKKYCGWKSEHKENGGEARQGTDWPRSRCASITISGVAAVSAAGSELANGLIPIAPGEVIEYQWQFNSYDKSTDRKRRSTHLFFSHGAPAGGEGDGGSLVHGLFGVVNVEPAGSVWYRSQVDAEIWNKVWQDKNGKKTLDYEARRPDGTPLLNMLKPMGKGNYELVHGDLNAVIREDKATISSEDSNPHKVPAFREFTVVFHDELKTFFADEFAELGREFSLSGVRDGFAINYGASGLGAMLLANRKGIGPAKECVECAYEEFFLESWANGDPALLHEYLDDPSNVHHSYLGERVVFRNLHAGPKETHVFHLHAHQWLAQDTDTGTYLDSQTIAPQQGFSYAIYYGGTGNRNVTPGDSIFHCHLYPHFAQGMWELWRAHDVLEDGTRRLPDGELRATDGTTGTNPLTGEIPPLDPAVAEKVGTGLSGTPIPAVVPLPGQAMPPEPTYGKQGFPGYPFYIAGSAGHRAPQAPLDIHEPAGLGRHVIQCPKDEQGKSLCVRMVSGIPPHELELMSPDEVVRHALLTADFSIELEHVGVRLLPLDGTSLEKAAMAFHAQKDIPSATPEGQPAPFKLNGSAPQPGAPFADPCQGWTFASNTFGNRTRRYEVAAIQTDLIVNKAGWHDPQARINVLKEDLAKFENKATERAKPFFFRANSGDCIEFYHTNRTRKETDLDDFQVRTPTDTIGQHIHLVKFDVTASDGSGNGFNYEDGTFARGALVERIEAADHKGIDIEGHTVKLRLPAKDEYQTTVQRWYADPLLARTKECQALVDEGKPNWRDDPACRDRTIRTVFTHDHFAPSTIQQHGFYAALLVEPRNSKLQYPDGTNMDAKSDKTKCQPEIRNGVFKSCAVGTQARILIDDDGSESPQEDYREFALAVADFALIYDGNEKARHHPKGLKGYDQLPSSKQRRFETLHRNLRAVQSKYGHPVDPPKLPEAISKDHHNPYLVNYRHEPLPLRIGCSDYEDNPEHCGSESVTKQRSGDPGDMAFAFSSWTHKDPGTEVFAGYEGEKVQLRVIQGAQEVQHMLNIHGHRWPREIGNPDSPLVAAQEIGISEHFEMKLGHFGDVTRGALFADSLYHFGSVDDLWNGAWGLIRNFSGYMDCDKEEKSNLTRCSSALTSMACSSKKLEDCLKPLPDIERNDDGSLKLANTDEYRVGGDESCPKELNGGRRITFYIDTVDVFEWLGKEVSYDDGHLFDPDSLAFVMLGRHIETEPGKDFPSVFQFLPRLESLRKEAAAKFDQQGEIDPLVLRANAGDCIRVVLFNQLPPTMADVRGDALMPRIVRSM